MALIEFKSAFATAARWVAFTALLIKPLARQAMQLSSKRMMAPTSCNLFVIYSTQYAN
jgi:hypothetical protein